MIATPKKEVPCGECQKAMVVTEARIKAGRGKYCSKECRFKGHGKNTSIRQIGRKLTKETKEKIRQATLKQFAEKGHPNLGRTWKIDEAKKVNMARPGQWEKENNPNWKGGVSPLRRLIRESREHKEWRANVFIRDNRICTWCGSNEEIQADHIKPFYRILEDNLITTIVEAQKCHELWNIDNGRTLCKACHMTTKTWGRPNRDLVNISVV